MYEYFIREGERESTIEQGMGVDEYQEIILLHEMGLTGHEDVGVIDGKYCDKVSLGPLSTMICIDKKLIDSKKDPAQARYDNLKKTIKHWHGEILTRNVCYSIPKP